jgi:peptidoglycan/xylan/chitin deacetylase (PgdA/CDA1 family)
MHPVHGLRRRLRYAVNALAPAGLILLYHRVTTLDSDPWALSVSPAHFAEHLEVIHELGQLLSLRGLSNALSEWRLPRRAIALTFDDGYADLAHNVRPLLEHHDVPATFFISTGFIDRSREFWWDDLERILLQPCRLPQTIRLTVRGRHYEWPLGPAAGFREEDLRPYRSWRAWEDPPSPRHRAYVTIWKVLRQVSDQERYQALDSLLESVGLTPTARKTHLPLSQQEMLELGRGSHVAFGAHGVTHPLLSTLSLGRQREEILQSKQEMETMLGRPVDSFSYPHGDYSADTIGLVREAGFSLACSTARGTVKKTTDRLRLPRLHVGNWSGAELARRIRKQLRS